MTEAATILETRELTFGFGGNIVTDRVSLSVREGEFLSIIGPNGAGKTTFFNVVTGLYRPSHGTIFYRGQDITSRNAAERARRGMARSFQLTNLFPGLSTWENVRLAAQAQSHHSYQLLRSFGAYRSDRESTNAMLELVGLTRQSASSAASLSHGDKRKLELAMVLAMEPQLLLLDEPTSGVSAEDVPDMVALIARIRETQQTTVMMVEHKMGVVLQLSDRIAVLHQGKLLALDTPDGIRKNELVQSAYLGTETL